MRAVRVELPAADGRRKEAHEVKPIHGEQIVRILKQAEAGMKMTEVCPTCVGSAGPRVGVLVSCPPNQEIKARKSVVLTLLLKPGNNSKNVWLAMRFRETVSARIAMGKNRPTYEFPKGDRSMNLMRWRQLD